jgi:hypothetical protein
MRKWTRFLSFAGLLLCLSTQAGHGQDRQKADAERPDPKKVKTLMRRKLDHSQQILEALALNDLKKAAEHAEGLIRVRQEVTWKVLRTKQYEKFSDDFNQSAEGIIKAAKDKNLEAAKIHYLGMTLTCFNCHTYVRDLGHINTEGSNRH